MHYLKFAVLSIELLHGHAAVDSRLRLIERIGQVLVRIRSAR
jgi:hypothetical protein